MRQTIVGLAVALAAAVSAAPASACGYAGCSAPSWNYNYSGFYGNYSTPVAPCAVGCGYAGWGGHYGHYAHLPYPAQPYASLPQYYWVNQGPTYTGPGMFAPAPTYQERAVSGWSGYGPTAYGTTNYSYSGGPYGNATTHYYDGMPAAGYGGYSWRTYSNLPATYRPYHRVHTPRYYRSMRYGYAPRFRRYVSVHRYAVSPRHMMHRSMRRMYRPAYN